MMFRKRSILIALISIFFSTLPLNARKKNRASQRTKITAHFINDEKIAPKFDPTIQDLAGKYRGINMLVERAKREAQMVARSAQRDIDQIMSRADRSKNKLDKRREERMRRERERKQLLLDKARERAEEVKRKAEMQSFKIIHAAEQRALELRQKLEQNEREDQRNARPEITSAWKKEVRRAFEADTLFIKNIIMQGEASRLERENFTELLKKQSDWFNKTVKKTNYFFDESYSSAVKKRNAIAVVVDAQRQADEMIADVVAKEYLSQKVENKLRLLTLYEINAYIASDAGKKSEFIGTSDLRKLVNKVTQLAFPAGKKIAIITEKQQVKKLEGRISQLEAELDKAQAAAAEEKAKQASIIKKVKAVTEKLSKKAPAKTPVVPAQPKPEVTPEQSGAQVSPEDGSLTEESPEVTPVESTLEPEVPVESPVDTSTAVPEPSIVPAQPEAEVMPEQPGLQASREDGSLTEESPEVTPVESTLEPEAPAESPVDTNTVVPEQSKPEESKKSTIPDVHVSPHDSPLEAKLKTAHTEISLLKERLTEVKSDQSSLKKIQSDRIKELMGTIKAKQAERKELVSAQEKLTEEIKKLEKESRNKREVERQLRKKSEEKIRLDVAMARVSDQMRAMKKESDAMVVTYTKQLNAQKEKVRNAERKLQEKERENSELIVRIREKQEQLTLLTVSCAKAHEQIIHLRQVIAEQKQEMEEEQREREREDDQREDEARREKQIEREISLARSEEQIEYERERIARLQTMLASQKPVPLVNERGLPYRGYERNEQPAFTDTPEYYSEESDEYGQDYQDDLDDDDEEDDDDDEDDDDYENSYSNEHHEAYENFNEQNSSRDASDNGWSRDEIEEDLDEDFDYEPTDQELLDRAGIDISEEQKELEQNDMADLFERLQESGFIDKESEDNKDDHAGGDANEQDAGVVSWSKQADADKAGSRKKVSHTISDQMISTHVGKEEDAALIWPVKKQRKQQKQIEKAQGSRDYYKQEKKQEEKLEEKTRENKIEKSKKVNAPTEAWGIWNKPELSEREERLSKVEDEFKPDNALDESDEYGMFDKAAYERTAAHREESEVAEKRAVEERERAAREAEERRKKENEGYEAELDEKSRMILGIGKDEKIDPKELFRRGDETVAQQEEHSFVFTDDEDDDDDQDDHLVGSDESFFE